MPRHDPLARKGDTFEQGDPREGEVAEIIDLATRNVLPQVAMRRTRSDALGVAAGVAIVALLGAATFWSMDTARVAQVRPATLPAVAQVQVPAPAVIFPDHAVTPASAPVAPPAARTAPVVAPESGINPLNSPTVVFDASALPAPQAGLAGPSAGPGTGTTGNANEDFANRLGGVGGSRAIASAGIDPKTTVAQGTLIPAVLETAIDTDVPGYARAIVSADVRSFDGSRVLVPRSSRLIGQYKSGLQAGQKRVYVIWTRLIRPDGVTVNIASPAIAYSGESGLDGKVNSHFFERFGSGMLLSVLGGLSAIGTGGASLVIAGSGQSAAATAVGQSGQIGPTIRIRQGEPVRVFTARDLDFSKVETE